MASRDEQISFDVVLKLAERCNLACKYCYYYFQEYDANQNLPIMSPEVQEELPRFLARSLEKLHLDQINIGLHGGEPLLMKKPAFDRLCTRVHEALDGKVGLRITLQTNGVLIDEEWIELFGKHEILVGVSIDGPKPAHDRLRIDHQGRGSYDRAVHGLRLLQDAVAEGRLRTAGALAVVPSENADQLLEHLIFELNVQRPNLNYPRGGWECEETAAWNRSLESSRKLVRLYLDKFVYPKLYTIRGLTDVLANLFSDAGARVNDRFASLRHYIATISSEGYVFPDDQVLAVDRSLADKSLTIFGTSLLDFVESPAWRKINDAVMQVPDECRSCEWYRSCRSGDLYNRFSKDDGYARKSALCDTIKMMHEEIADYLVRRKALTVEQLAERLSQPPVVTSEEMLRKMMRKAGGADPTDYEQARSAGA